MNDYTSFALMGKVEHAASLFLRFLRGSNEQAARSTMLTARVIISTSQTRVARVVDG